MEWSNIPSPPPPQDPRKREKATTTTIESRNTERIFFPTEMKRKTPCCTSDPQKGLFFLFFVFLQLIKTLRKTENKE